MLLVVDAGNTNTVMAVHDGKNWLGRWRIATDAQRTSDEYAVWLLTLLSHAGVKREQVGAAVIGTVVPAALYDLALHYSPKDCRTAYRAFRTAGCRAAVLFDFGN